MALKLSFPVQEARRALCRLVAVSIALETSPDIIKLAVSKLSRKYREAVNVCFFEALFQALDSKDVWMVYAMGC
jgi:hypothetical protein